MSDTTPPQFLSEPDCRALVARIIELSNHHDTTEVHVDSQWNSSVRWARNRASTLADARDTALEIDRGRGRARLNQLDSASLSAAVQWAELMARFMGTAPDKQKFTYAPPQLVYPKTSIWSESTYAITSDQRAIIANTLMASAERAGMLSAGYLDIGAGSRHLRLDDGRMLYARYTTAECSLTVRDPEGSGSGWAGASSYDWGRIDANKLAEIALDKCLRSRNPVRIEPGRYTVILEPQATYDFISRIMKNPGVDYMDWDWESDWINIPGAIQHPFFDSHKYVKTSQWGRSTGIGVTKIGQRLLDPRITISFDPEDPALGDIPFTVRGDPYVPVTWWDQGVLKTLAYGRKGGPDPTDMRAQPNGGVFRMSGGTATIEEMIATTARGLLVTRFWGITMLDQNSILCSGVTRDGLWLIEHGKISHPVKNLRFTESPLFVFNNVEQLGVPVPVFAPRTPAIVPPVKVQDFSFTSLVDAV